MKELLLARKYPEALIDRSLKKALQIPRKVALLKVKAKDQENRPIFALKFDPRMPSVQPMLSKHYRSMKSQDTYLNEVFAKPPLTVFRRQQHIRNFIIKAKVPPPPEHYPKRLLKGMKNCGKACSACPFIEDTVPPVSGHWSCQSGESNLRARISGDVQAGIRLKPVNSMHLEKHCENRKTLPFKHHISCQCVKLFFT